MYHKFGIDKYPTTSVTIDQFNSHIVEFTKEKYSVKSLEYIVDTIINDGNLPENTIGISIDDADKSFYEVGWPIFKKIIYLLLCLLTHQLSIKIIKII